MSGLDRLGPYRLQHLLGDARQVVHLAGHLGHARDRLARGFHHGTDARLDLLSGFGGLTSQVLDLTGHHGKALAGFASASRFDGGVESQKARAIRHFADHGQNARDLLGSRFQTANRFLRLSSTAGRLYGQARFALAAFQHPAGLELDLADSTRHLLSSGTERTGLLRNALQEP